MEFMSRVRRDPSRRHCEKRSDEAIQGPLPALLDCRVGLTASSQ